MNQITPSSSYKKHIAPSKIFKTNPLDHSFVRPNLILEKRNGDVIGKLIYEDLSFNLLAVGASDFQITVHKVNDNNTCGFWDEIKDLQIINWVGFKRFVIDIDLNESTEIIKHINCISLEADELSQATLRNFHVNDEEAMTTLDPDNKFKPTMLYVKGDPEHSLLDRILKAKTKHWQVNPDGVDKYFNVNGKIYRAANLQREFTVDGQTPYDFLEGDVSKECGCTFIYDTYNRMVNCYNTNECVFDTTTMEVVDDIFYDLDIHTFYKYEDGNKVYVTGNYEYLPGIGDDTTIMLTSTRLSEDVTVDSDKDSIKNCFYVTGGDDIITNYVAASNASGTNYIYNFDYQYDLMSDGLVEKIKDYQEFYKEKENTFNKVGGVFVYDSTVYYDNTSKCYKDGNANIIVDDNIRKVNGRICVLSPYSYYENGTCYNEDGTIITTTHTYEEPGLYIKYCQAVDRLAYWEHNKFPNMTVENTTATAELAKLKTYLQNNPIIITNACNTNSFSHVTLLIENICNVVVDNRYTVKTDKYAASCDKINNDQGFTQGHWTGNITITRDTDETDFAEEQSLSVLVKKSQNSTEDIDYCNQKIKIALAKMDASELPLTYNMSTEDDDNELRALFSEYNLQSLKAFRESFSSCNDVLADLKTQMLSTDDERQEYLSAAFDKAFEIYENRKNICIEYSGTSSTESTSDITVVGITEVIVNKWQAEVDRLSNEIVEFQQTLNIEEYLGDYYTEFLSFVREDEYNNGNYNSNNLGDADILYWANELRKVATAELKKASKIHYTISGTINNIFNIDQLSTIKDNFCLFNYVRYIVDDKVYKLRLLGISGNEDSLDKISITFGDVVSCSDNPAQEEQDKLNAAASMSTSYNSTTFQARQGSSAYNSVGKMKTEGLNSAEYIIKNSNAEIIHDDHGSLYKTMDDTNVFAENQLRITPAGMYLTDDAWKTTGMAVGTVIMTNPTTGLKQKYFGTIADYIYGNLIAGNGLEIANADGSVKIDGSGIELDGGTIRWKNNKLSEDDVEGLTNDLSEINSTIIDITDDIEQLDGRIQTYSQSTLPSTSWTTTEEKDKHINDVWLNTATSSFVVSGVTYYPGETYVYTKSGNTYSWVITQDSILKGLAMSNATIFTAKPDKLNDVGYLYHKGDLWILGTDTTVNSVTYKKYTILTTTADNTTTIFKDSDWIPVTTKAATDFASDSIITPGEKIQLKYTMMDITQEYTEISNQAAKYTMDISDLTSKYNTLKTYTDGFLANMNVNSEDVNPTTYSTNFSNYYNARKTAEGNLETARVNYSDGKLNNFINNTYNPYVESAQSQIDQKISSYYQANTPYVNKTNVDATSALDALVGDLWYETGTGKTYIYQKTNGTTSGKYNYTWTFEDVPDAVFDLIDGKKNIYILAPTTDVDGDGYLYRKGDMWIISSDDQTSSNTNVKNLAKQYKVKTILASSVDRVKTSSFTPSDWSLLTTESAEQALADIADMCNDGKLTGVEKIQITRRLAEIDDEKAIYQAKKNAYSSNTSVTTAWSIYESNYNTLKTQSANWALNSTTTTDITTASFTNYFTAYYSAKETLDAALEAASKKYAEDQAGVVQDNLTSFKSKVQGALTGNSTTEIGNDYIISPKIGGGYLYLVSNATIDISGSIDPFDEVSESLASLYTIGDTYLNTSNNHLYELINKRVVSSVCYLTWQLITSSYSSSNFVNSIELNPSGGLIKDYGNSHTSSNYIIRATVGANDVFSISKAGNAYFSGKITATSGTIGGWDIDGSTGILHENSSTDYFKINASTHLLTTRKGVNRTDISAGDVIVYYQDNPILTLEAGTWSGTSIKGATLHSKVSSKFISFGNEDSSSDTSYTTSFLINYGLNPNGRTQDVQILGTSYFSDTATFNGGISLGNISGGYYRSIRATVGSNDYVGIKFSSGGNNDGFLALDTGDDGNEPIIARQWSGNPFGDGSSWVRRAYILDSAGDTQFPGCLGVGGAKDTNYKLKVNGTSYFSDIIATTSNNFIKCDYGSFHFLMRNDGSNVYFMSGSSSGAYDKGYWYMDSNANVHLNKAYLGLNYYLNQGKLASGNVSGIFTNGDFFIKERLLIGNATGSGTGVITDYGKALNVTGDGYISGNLTVDGVGIIKQLNDGGHQISMGWNGSELQVVIDSTRFKVSTTLIGPA